MRRRVAFCTGLILAVPSLVAGQQSSEALRLQLTYESTYRPGVAVLAFSGSARVSDLAVRISDIIRNDLRLSDRFEMVDHKGAITLDPIVLEEAGATWAVTGEVRPDGRLAVRVHDIVYGTTRHAAVFDLPASDDPNWRLAIHGVADQVVAWVTGEPGMAASRIIFVMKEADGSELYAVDSDGQNLTRITGDRSIVLSPAWSPLATRVAYTSYKSGRPILYERDLLSGREAVIADSDGMNGTPAYGPSGTGIAYASSAKGRSAIRLRTNDGDLAVTEGRYDDAISPSFSPDGKRLAYVSNKLGNPHLFVYNLEGAGEQLLSTFALGGSAYLQAPDWSPAGDLIVFHTRIEGTMQLAVVRPDGLGLRYLTDRGRNEDPSWAPDSRHVVFTSDRDGGGLFVLDTVTGTTRKLVGGRAQLADWSSALVHTQFTADAAR